MILRNRDATWLISADRFAFGNFRFAPCAVGEHPDCGASPYSKLSAPICQNRYPSPSLRPDPCGVRPLLHGRMGFPACWPGGADWFSAGGIRFRPRRTLLRFGRLNVFAGGRAECVLPGLFAPLRWLGWSAAACQTCRRINVMPLSAVSAARPSRLRPTAMSWPVPRLVPLAGRSATTWASAGNLTVRPYSGLTASTPEPSGQAAPVVFCFDARRLPWRALKRGQRCSRRS